MNFPTLEEFDEIKKMPAHVPGVVTTIDLSMLPDYLAINGLKPNGMSATGVLLVRKTEDAAQPASAGAGTLLASAF